MLHPDEPSRVPYVSSVLSDAPGPVVAVSDWIKAVPDQIARWVPGTFTSLGTDGFGFSDTRPAARRFFHVDAESITVAVLWELARSGTVDAARLRRSPSTASTCRSARRCRRRQATAKSEERSSEIARPAEGPRPSRARDTTATDHSGARSAPGGLRGVAPPG